MVRIGDMEVVLATTAENLPQTPPGDAAGADAHSRRQTPAFVPLLEMFCAKLSAGLGRSVSGGARLRVASVEQTTREAFLAGVGEPLACFALEAGSAARDLPPIMLDFDRQAASLLVERLLGGSDAAAPAEAARPLTGLDHRVLRRVAALAAEALSRARPADTALRLELADGHWWQQPVDPKQSGEAVIAAQLKMTLGSRSAAVRLALPAATAAALGLDEPRSGVGDAAGRTAPLEITVATEDAELQREALEGLADGDIVTCDTPADGEVIVRVAGIPKFAGRLCTSNGQRAITITRRL